MTVPKINSAHGSDTRNIINRAIEVLNRLGIDVQTLVAEGQLTPGQYASLITTINGLIKSGHVDKSDLTSEFKDEIEGFSAQLAEDVRKKAIPISSSDISDELKQQINGNAPIAQTIAPSSVSPLKTTFFKRGSQLFNKDAAIQGKRIDSGTGNLVNSSSFHASDFILVSPSKAYHKNDDFHHYAWYDSQFNYISGGTSGLVPQRVITSPSNAYYLRTSTSNTIFDSYMLNEGDTELPHANYIEFIDTDNIREIPVSKINGRFGKSQVDFITRGKNLFDLSRAVIGEYVSQNSGNFVDNDTHFRSDYIEVEGNATYVFSQYNSSLRVAYYDAYKNFISGVLDPDGGVITTPANTRNFVFSISPSNIRSNMQVEKGNTPTTYEPFGYFLDGVEVSGSSGGGGSAEQDEILVFLPDEINIAVGRTIELYNKQVVWSGNMDNFHIQWVSNIGRSFKRKWSFTAGSANIGEYELRINVYDNNMKQVATQVTTVNVVDDVIETPVNLLNIGDSLSNNKPWYGEVRNLSNNAINFVGTRWSGMGGSLEGQRNEGRSGATAGNYLSDYTYTFDSNGVGSENPFWNPTTEVFDFNYYKSNYDVDPDAVQLFLGTNGINIDPTENANNIKEIVDGIRQSDATIPIFVVNTLYRGDQDGIGNQANNDGYSAARGQWKLEEDRKVFNLMVRLDELLGGYSNVHFVPIALTHDSEYNFGQEETPVNPRNTFTLPQPVEATHPQTPGYLQMADIMFSTMVAKFD